ncbi:unnamed protein product [Ascophyllum nodosum]
MMADGAGEANGAAQRTGGQLDDGEVGEKVCQDSVEGGEYEEEEVYVMVELPPDIDGEELLSASAVTVQGVGTSNPTLRVGGEVFAGKTEPIVGTTVVFKTPPPGAAGSRPLELACYSNMRMNFNNPGERRRKKPKR